MFVLGIDPGLTRCGYGAVTGDGGVLHAAAAGVLTTDKTAETPERLGALLGDLRALIADLRPDAVVLERVFFQTNAHTAVGVMQASGVAMALAHEAGCSVAQYTSNEVKQAVTGYGSAPKEQVQRMVQMLLRLDKRPHPADAADALALALCHHTVGAVQSRVQAVESRHS